MGDENLLQQQKAVLRDIEAGVGATPAAPGSVLDRVRKARKKALRELTLDLQVPRLDPPVYVRFKPVQLPQLDAANKRAAELARAKDPDAEVIANAIVLTHACVGVFGTVDGKPHGAPDSWPRFGDPDLTEALDLPEGATAVDAVRALYLTDGDIVSTASELNGWSAPAIRRLDEDTAGN